MAQKDKKKRQSASTTRSSTQKENSENPSPSKRLRYDASSMSVTDFFLNPFPHVEASTKHQLPPSTYTQLPEDQIQYGFTPTETISQQEARNRLGSSRADPELVPPVIQETISPAIDPSLSPGTPNYPEANPFGLIPKTNNTTFFRSLPSEQTTSPVIPGPLLTPFSSHSAADRSSSPPLAGPSRISMIGTPLPVHIPKIITDRISEQHSRISALEQKGREDAHMIHQLQADVDELDNENRLLQRRVDITETQLEKHKIAFDKLSKLVENLGAVPGTSHDDNSHLVSKARDNALNTASRKAFYLAMGLPSTSKLRDAARVKPKKSGGYVRDTETNGKLLRPDWRISFSDNSSWHIQTIQFFRQKIPLQNPVISRASIAAKTDEEILERIEVVFKNISAEYRRQSRTSTGTGDDGSGDEVGGDLKQLGRRKGRKVRKCEERIEALHDAEVVITDLFAFFLQPKYQSTDESDPEDVLDPDTDTEKAGEIPAHSTRKPWISRPPAYRVKEFQTGIDNIDIIVMKRRKDFAANNHGKTSAHPRIRGPAREKRLPYMGMKKKRITRKAISPEWLAAHSEDDTPSRIQGDDEPEPIEEDEADDEDDESGNDE